jgi:hypothetical protein
MGIHALVDTDAVQTFTVTAESGTFNVTFDGQTTAPLTVPLLAADMKTALELLSNIDSVAVTSTALKTPNTRAYHITFTANVAMITAADATLIGTQEVQTVVITATSGTFNLEFSQGGTSQTTTALHVGTSAAEVKAALEGLSNIGADNVGVSLLQSVVGTSTYSVTFTGNTATTQGPVALITVPSNADLVGTGEIQTVTISAASGTFKLAFDTEKTANLTVPLLAADMQTALEGLSNIGTGNVGTVTSTDTALARIYTITFTGATATTAGNVAQITAVDDDLAERLNDPPFVGQTTTTEGTAASSVVTLVTAGVLPVITAPAKEDKVSLSAGVSNSASVMEWKSTSVSIGTDYSIEMAFSGDVTATVLSVNGVPDTTVLQSGAAIAIANRARCFLGRSNSDTDPGFASTIKRLSISRGKAAAPSTASAGLVGAHAGVNDLWAGYESGECRTPSSACAVAHPRATLTCSTCFPLTLPTLPLLFARSYHDQRVW